MSFDVTQEQAERDPMAIPGWFRWADANPIMAGCRAHGMTGTMVEIGTWCGRSTAAFSSRLPGWTFWTVDNYKREAIEFWGTDLARHPQIIAAEALAGMRNVRRIVMDSLDAVPLLPTPDVLFVDGDHTRERVALELRAWIPRLRADALVFLHDCDWPAVVQGIADGFLGEPWDRAPEFECEEQFLRCYRRAPA